MSIDVMTLAVSKKYTDKQIEKVSIKGVDLSGYVQSVNGVKPDKNGNVEVSGGNVDCVKTVNGIKPDENGNIDTSQNVDMTGYAKETWVQEGFQPKGEYLESAELPNAINTALAQAKASGEFDGKDGKDGQNGSAGKDGVSATHSWNGTTLTITSASGTSSANLKGEKGDKGDKGDSIKGDKGDTGAAGTSVTVKSVSESTTDGGSNVVTFSDGKTLTVQNGRTGGAGKDGSDGYTPVKGVDYYTDEEKAEFESIIADEMAKRAQITPEFAADIDECTDTTKLYVLPDGYIYAYIPQTGDNNILPEALGADGKVYNEIGYKANVRWSGSSQAESSATGIYLSGWIPVTTGDVVYLKNITMNKNTTVNNECILWIATGLGSTTGNSSAANIAAYHSAEWDSDGNLVKFSATSDGYIRLQAAYIGEDSIVTINEEYAVNEDGRAWQNTGHAFVPADYEARIVTLEEQADQNETDHTSLENRVKLLESAADGSDVPEYWLTALQEGAEAINTALCEAGRNKSAFLFYSDSHWNYGAQISPVLLKYLYKHTGMTKTIFGGDIVNDEASDYDTMEYLWEWRTQLKDLPNHHSVPGNHDDGNSTNNLFPEQYVYGYLLAAEETPDIVCGDSGLYYYIDNPAEKTRYLYLDTGYKDLNSLSAEQSAFITQSLISTPTGWHIVVVAHVWYVPDYNQYDVRPVPVAGLSTAAASVVAILDNYNSRAGDFANCGAWVEFCIGGHIHYDYDAETSTGIPVILVETDSQHIRGTLSYTAGTTTESSVNGIIADYDNKKISVIRIGRGASREISY